MEYGRNLHRTSKVSHSITKSSSSSSSSSNSSSSSSSSGSDGHRSSHSQRPPNPVPVIRVVHIFNPTVIKTDAANFRSLVQELTGRSCNVDKGTRGGKSRQRFVSAAQPHRMLTPQKFLPATCITVPKRTPMYIPERLGTFSDIDIMSSFQEPASAIDLSTMLPSLDELNSESLPRCSSFYESF